MASVSSVLRSGLPNYEILLIDDGSTDGTAALADSLADENSCIRCIHQKNAGVSAARNRGLSEATGDYVLFMDADDIIDSKRLRMLSEVLVKDPLIDMAVFGLSFDYYHKERCYCREELPPCVSGILTDDVWARHLKELFYSNSLSPIWNKIIRRSILQENGVQLREDMFLYEDLEYSLRIMARCDRVLFDPTIIYHYIQNSGNAVSRLQRMEHITSVLDPVEEALKLFLSEKGMDEEMRASADDILLALHLTLAREKIAVSRRKEISVVCDDFAAWYKDREYRGRSGFIDLLLDHRVTALAARRILSSLRHRAAVAVKCTVWYQKWKGDGHGH